MVIGDRQRCAISFSVKKNKYGWKKRISFTTIFSSIVVFLSNVIVLLKSFYSQRTRIYRNRISKEKMAAEMIGGKSRA